jgi:hypothetical protein
MPRWPPYRESHSASVPESSLAPHTGNKKLDKQLRAARERELREVPHPTVITPTLAIHARSLMLDACDGRPPRLASNNVSERERDEFLNQYFTQKKIDELPDITSDEEPHDGAIWKRIQVL